MAHLALIAMLLSPMGNLAVDDDLNQAQRYTYDKPSDALKNMMDPGWAGRSSLLLHIGIFQNSTIKTEMVENFQTIKWNGISRLCSGFLASAGPIFAIKM